MTTGKRNIIIYFVVVLLAVLLLLPTFMPAQFAGRGWISKPISLGLDLSGGAHILYEVKTAEAVRSRLQSLGSAIRKELRGQKIVVTKVATPANDRLEITLLTGRKGEEAQEIVRNNFRDLRPVEQRPDGEKLVLIYTVAPEYVAAVEREAVSQAVETIRSRVDQFGVSEPLINTQGQNRIQLQMPGVSDVEAVKKLVGKVAKLEFRLLPVGGSEAGTVTVRAIEGGAQVRVEDEVRMTGDAVADAATSIDQGRVEVLLTLTGDGERTFAELTSQNVGRQLAIILDGTMYSAPSIREPIYGGRASISGNFTVEEARQLKIVLKAGALPAPLEVLEERTVGPTLGRESIENGVKAILAGFAFIILFMVGYYKKSGVVAVTSLFLNMLLLLALLSMFGATLTLPGLAGLALTIGMAVDSNVIIFERIREEIRNGSGRDASVRAGFERALSAILDSNITTLISGMILLYLGTGAIRGFAVTLCIGILTTIYCATFATRVWFDTLELRGSKGLSV